MKLTIQLQLLPDPTQAQALLDVLCVGNAAANRAAEIGFAHGAFRQYGIHSLAYYHLREAFGLPAQLTIRCISKAVDSFSRDRTICPVFRPDGAIPLDQRLFIVKGDIVGITVLQGRIQMPFVCGEHQRQYLSCKMGQADLIHRRGKFFLNVVVEVTDSPFIETTKFLGIDFGIVNLATDSDGQHFSGEVIDRNRRRRATARKQYQRKGTKNAKRRLKKMAGRQRRFQTHENHRISKKIVAKAKALGVGIALEDLTGIRGRVEETASVRFRRRLGNWGFSQLRRFVEYKARLAGVPVVLVDPRNTSRTCSQCRHCEKTNRPDQATFKCKQCGHSEHADVNAAKNISSLGLKCNPAPKATVLASSINEG